MRRLTLIWAAVAVALLVAYAVGAALGLEAVLYPAGQFQLPALSTALLGVALLVFDVVLPVPSSVVMVALGAAFGAVAGTALSTLGGVGSLCLAGWLGRRSRTPVQRWLADDLDRAETLVARYGAVAVMVSRPVPVLAESVALVAAASGMRPLRFIAAGVAGVVPVSLVYAAAGRAGGQANGLVLAAVLIGMSLAGIAVEGARHRHDVRRAATATAPPS